MINWWKVSTILLAVVVAAQLVSAQVFVNGVSVTSPNEAAVMADDWSDGGASIGLLPEVFEVQDMPPNRLILYDRDEQEISPSQGPRLGTLTIDALPCKS